MPTCKATVEFRLEAQSSIEQAGAALQKLQEAARDVGFTDVTGQVGLSDDEDDAERGWKGYGPRVDPND